MSYTERACAINLGLQSLLWTASLNKRDWCWHLTSAFSQLLQKYTFTAVHTKTHRWGFQIYPLWRAFSNLCVYSERFDHLRVEGGPKRIKKVCVYYHLHLQSSSCGRGMNHSCENEHDWAKVRLKAMKRSAISCS